jgi:ATP-dependent Clp protease ATP-binding subunit ClpA
MSAEDFSEASYTEAAWAAIAALPRVADYYSATTVEAPMLLDVLLNPSKHSAGENAEAAKVVIDKVLAKAGINAMELRQQLENYMAKQPKITSGGTEQQKTMGRSLQNVLEAARNNKAILNVSQTLRLPPSLMINISFLFCFCGRIVTSTCEGRRQIYTFRVATSEHWV